MHRGPGTLTSKGRPEAAEVAKGTARPGAVLLPRAACAQLFWALRSGRRKGNRGLKQEVNERAALSSGSSQDVRLSAVCLPRRLQT